MAAIVGLSVSGGGSSPAPRSPLPSASSPGARAGGEPSDRAEPQGHAARVTAGRTSVFADSQGTHRGLTAVAEADRPRARAVIEHARTGPRGTKAGYEREAFGPAWTDAVSVTWGRNGCRTREDILRRDLAAVTLRPGTAGRDGEDCVVLDGLLSDPYTGTLIEFNKSRAQEVQIDHVIPLFYAWQLGAARWTADERRVFANDPLNLLAVSGPANAQKNASGPASWLPPNRPIRCAYGVRFALVAERYALPVTIFDRTQMLRQCA